MIRGLSLPVTRVLCWSLAGFTEAEILVELGQTLPAGSRPRRPTTGSRAGKEAAARHVARTLGTPAWSPPAGTDTAVTGGALGGLGGD